MSLLLSLCLCSVSICSPLLCCTSPQLPVFCSFGLFSLHLSLLLPCLLAQLSLPPVHHPSICSRPWSYLCESSGLGRTVTTRTQERKRFTQGHDAQRKTTALHVLPLSPVSCYSLATFVASVCSCAASFAIPSHIPLKINTGCLLLIRYQRCHIPTCCFKGR